ncbi:hypothetical protein HK104_010712 [Borealophlyctis nickersoniae]|nr:hypothetical protein HK104_010712 [Borealophlyctis nickersoniae]
MTATPPPPVDEQSVSSSSDTPTNASSIAPDALRMRTVATASTDPTHPAPSPAKPAVYKWRTKKEYRKVVQDFKAMMIIVYPNLALCIVFALANLAKFKERQGCVVYLAAAQLVAIPVSCGLIYLSYWVVIGNKVILLCLNMQAVLAYVDVNDEAGMDSFSEFLEALTGFIGFIGATFVEGLMSWSALTWFHDGYWREMQVDVERNLRE